MKNCWALVLLAAAACAHADEADGLRCRTLADPAARLACYDAWADGRRTAVTPAAPAREVSKAGGGEARTAAGAAAGAVGAAPAAANEQFGLEHRQSAAAAESIESRISGLFEGWDPGTMFTLANGQIWQVADDSRGTYYLRDPKVRVRRGLLGAFYIEIEGANRSPRVKRLR